MLVLAVLGSQNGGSCSKQSAQDTSSAGTTTSHPLGRCLSEPVVAGGGAVVLYDIIVNLQSMRVFFVGPHKALWIVPVTPPLQAKTVPFIDYFGEGRDLHWIPIRHDAASICDFAGGERAETTYISVHGDPYGHVNLASCPLPVWAAEKIHAGTRVEVELALAPKPLFHALSCTESAGTHAGACEACRDLVARQRPTDVTPNVQECYNASHMALRFVRLPALSVCLPPALPPVQLSLCCIIKNEARYLAEWIEYSKLIGVSRFYLYDHNSTDNTHAALAPYISSGTVVLHNWSLPGYPQIEVHTHCTHRYAHQTAWLGLLGAQFTCFTSTKLQLLTQKAGLDGVLSGEEKENELLALHVQKYEH